MLFLRPNDVSHAQSGSLTMDIPRKQNGQAEDDLGLLFDLDFAHLIAVPCEIKIF